MKFNIGDRVRLINNPGKMGIFTGKTRVQGNNNGYQVKFDDHYAYYGENQLETVPEFAEDPIDLFIDKKFGVLKNLQQILNHTRLSGKLVDYIYSMESTNTEFYAFQFKPVLKILDSVSNGLLIADEVGLGKTIEAGLIWTELRNRFDLKRLFILCPSMLKEKWKIELKNRFGIDAKILNANETLLELQNAKSDENYQFNIIASIEGLRPYKDWKKSDFNDNFNSGNNKLNLFLDDNLNEQNLIDLLIIDEAHYARNPETQNSKLAKLLRLSSDYAVLLTATPIHLKNDDLYNLIRIIDEEIFSNYYDFEFILQANEPLVKLRDKILYSNLKQYEFIQQLEKIKEQPILSKLDQIKWLSSLEPTDQQLKDPAYKSFLAYKLDTINFLGNIISRNRKRDVIEKRVIRDARPILIQLTPIEEKFYNEVTMKLRSLSNKKNGFDAFILSTPQRQMSSSMPAALHYWKFKNNNNEDASEYFDDDFNFFDNLENDRKNQKPILEELKHFASNYNYDLLVQNDTKLKELLIILKSIIKSNPNEKIIIFSYFRATIEYLNKQLSKNGLNNLILTGGKKINYVDTIQEFEKNKKVSILISSEVGSEGIDLQFCKVIINYDLPWNPMKIEQRIGRIDRLGQTNQKIIIYNLFYDKTIDSRIYYKLFERLKIFEKALGISEAILGDKIQKLTNELLSGNLTIENEEEIINQTAIAVENKNKYEEELENKASNLIAYGDYILNKVKIAKELNRWINEEDIFNYINIFFLTNYRGSIISLKNDKYEISIDLSKEAKQELESFVKFQKMNTRTNLYTLENKPIKCIITSKLSQINNPHNFEVINQVHPLVRFISFKLSKNKNSTFYPALVSKINFTDLSKPITRGTYIYLIQKWTIEGIQSKEKLFFCGVRLGEDIEEINEIETESLIISTIKHGSDLYKLPDELNFDKIKAILLNNCINISDMNFSKFKNENEFINNDRVKFQIESLEKHFSNQEKKYDDIIESLRQKNQNSLIAATEGKKQKLKNKIERQILHIKDKSKLLIDKEDISAGLIQVV